EFRRLLHRQPVSATVLVLAGALLASSLFVRPSSGRRSFTWRTDDRAGLGQRLSGRRGDPASRRLGGRSSRRSARPDPAARRPAPFGGQPGRGRGTPPGRRGRQALARGQVWGPLHGVGVTVEDVHATAGMRSTFGGYRPFAEHVPAADPTGVAR